MENTVFFLQKFSDKHFDYFETTNWEECVENFKQAAMNKWNDLRCGYRTLNHSDKEVHFLARYRKNNLGIWEQY